MHGSLYREKSESRDMEIRSFNREVRNIGVRYTEGTDYKKNVTKKSGICDPFVIPRGSLYRRYVISRVDCSLFRCAS